MTDAELVRAVNDAACQVKWSIECMDWYTAGQFLWQCLNEHYPELGGGALQVIGGATVLYRGLGWLRSGSAPKPVTPAPSAEGGNNGANMLLNILGKLAMNKLG